MPTTSVKAFKQCSRVRRSPASTRQAPRQAISRACATRAQNAEVVAPLSSRRQAGLLLGSALLAVGLPAWATAPKKVFVAGSTGQTGKQVVAALRAQGIEVVAGVRNPSKAEDAGYNKDSGITVKVADVTNPPAETAKALSGCDAVICATGGGAVSPFDKRAKKVDNQGTKNLVDAAQQAGVGSFVLVSSLLTNAKAVGQDKNPNYVILQIFGGVLEEKLQAEKYLRASSLRWTIVRPGGLSSDPPSKVGNVITGKEDTFLGLDGDPGREVSRTSVAEVCVQALLQDGAKNKVVEVVASTSAPELTPEQWFKDL